jgi:lipopolysaccharide export system protein LptA
MIRSPRIRGLLVAAWLLGLWLAMPAAASSQDTPLIVEGDLVTYDQGAQLVEATGAVRLQYRGIRLSADRVTFDVAREFLTAEGQIVLVDASGRELRGDALRYDVRLGLAEVRRAEVVVDRFYLRSEQLQVRPGVLTATDGMLTPCDPARPVIRITARRIELHPGDRLVATEASLWVGSFRVFTLPVYTVSLRTREETAQNFPRLGYSGPDGLWLQYVHGYSLGTVRGALLTKYGMRSGLIARNSLTYGRPPFSLDLTVGRNQDEDLQIYDQAEASLALAEQPLGGLPVLYSLELRHGWFQEATTGLGALRTRYGVGFRVPQVALAPAVTLKAGASWSDAVYGTGDRQGVIRGNVALTRALDDRRTVSFTYDVLEVIGATPFLLDAVDPADLVNKAAVRYGQSGARGAVSTAFTAGAGYDFRARSPLAILGYGEQLAGRYHWGAAAEYALGTADATLTVGAGHAIGHGTYAQVQAVYHTLTGAFEDLDFVITSRLCDCLDVTVIYRQVRSELWLEIGLGTISQSRLQFLLPRP